MRDADFRYDGGMTFNLQLALGRERLGFRPCVDGQFRRRDQAYRGRSAATRNGCAATGRR